MKASEARELSLECDETRSLKLILKHIEKNAMEGKTNYWYSGGILTSVKDALIDLGYDIRATNFGSTIIHW